MPHPPHVGILAVQGGVAEHATALTAVGARVTLVRSPHQITGPDGPRIDALILPGGESTTQDTLTRMLDLADPLRNLIRDGLPTLGTCAGLILLATRIEHAAPGQRSLGGLDVTVSRNAWGTQLASHETDIPVTTREISADQGRAATLRGAFIRAPEILRVGDDARVFARFEGRIVGATSRRSDTPSDSFNTHTATLGSVTGISFHPELSGDYRLHHALTRQATAGR